MSVFNNQINFLPPKQLKPKVQHIKSTPKAQISTQVPEYKETLQDVEQRENESKIEEIEGRASVRALVTMMEQDSNPKFQESDFLKFLKRIDRGEVKIKGNELVQGSGKGGETLEEQLERNFEVAFKEAEAETKLENLEVNFGYFWKLLFWCDSLGREMLRGFFI